MKHDEDKMSDEQACPSPGRVTRWMAFVLGWTLLGLFQSARLYYLYSLGSTEVSWVQSAAMGLADWYLWGALSPFIFMIGRRLDFDRSAWLRSVGMHLVLSFVFALAQLALYSIAFAFLREVFSIPLGTSLATWRGVFLDLLGSRLFAGILAYLMIAFVSYAILYYRRLIERERQLTQARVHLTEARLEALKGHLQPHFLFNTLNAITALIHTDPDAADTMIARLSDLLRKTLELQQRQFTSLAEEAEFASHYLGIQQARFEDRLQVAFDIQDSVADSEVPTLILQPIVENAVKHGIALRREPGRITVSARMDAGRLVVEILNDGPSAAPPPAHDKTGGLDNVLQRLETLYPNDFEFSLDRRSEGGAMVRVVLPYRPSPRETTT